MKSALAAFLIALLLMFSFGALNFSAHQTSTLAGAYDPPPSPPGDPNPAPPPPPDPFRKA